MTPPTIRESLLDQHRQLELLFDEVLEAAEVGVDKRRLDYLWHRFDDALLAHLRAEERDLFPAMEKHHYGEVQVLKLEHARIRSAMEGLDIAVQLHVLRTPLVEDFLALLRDHAAREGAGIYQWAETELSALRRRGLLGRVGRAA